MSNNIPVNGWPRLKDLEAVQPTLDRLDKIEAWKRTVKEETFTGSELTIENALALPARSLITSINAIQDLHGLPFPYVGGAYKNKLPLDITTIKARNTIGSWSGNTYTVNGMTVTVQTDADGNVIGIATNGTPSAEVQFVLTNDGLTFVDEIILNGCPSGGSFNDYMLYSTNSGGADYGSGITITANTSHAYMIIIRANVNVNGKVFKPMLRLSTESDASFAPWENKCPISGRTEARVYTENEDSTESAYAVIQLGQTVYGGEVDFNEGAAKVTDGYIASYDGETLPSTWISDRDVYAEGTTPTTGAEVVYKLATPTTLQLTPTQLEMLKGYNRVTLSDGYGTIELKALTGANWS